MKILKKKLFKTKWMILVQNKIMKKKKMKLKFKSR